MKSLIATHREDEGPLEKRGIPLGSALSEECYEKYRNELMECYKECFERTLTCCRIRTGSTKTSQYCIYSTIDLSPFCCIHWFDSRLYSIPLIFEISYSDEGIWNISCIHESESILGDSREFSEVTKSRRDFFYGTT